MYQFLASTDLEHQISQMSTSIVTIASLLLIVLVIIAVLTKNHQAHLKLPLFLAISIILVGTTGFLLTSTIYLNVKSESKGPVHWHTDIEFWACGTEIELRDPTGFLSNKIGTATYHEHNDKRIHLEGVVVKTAEDASLGKFMKVTGGDITGERISIPLNENPDKWFVSGESQDGDKQDLSQAELLRTLVKQAGQETVLELRNGPGCAGEHSELQVFQYTFDKATSTYSQRKLQDPASYTMRDESIVPPGDCLIVEYDSPRDRTDKLCEQYGLRDDARCTEFGVSHYDARICNIREVAASTEDI